MGLGKASFIEKCPLYTTFLFLRGGGGNKGGHKPKLMFIISRGTMNEICVGESNIYWEGGGDTCPIPTPMYCTVNTCTPNKE